MTLRQKIKQHKTRLYIAITLSAAVLVFGSQAAALFKASNDLSILCVILASAAFGTLLFIVKYIHAGILCFAVLIAAAVFSRDIVAVVWSLVYIPSGWIMCRGVLNKTMRTALTVHIAVFAGIIYAILIAGSLAAENGGISPEIVYNAVDEEISAVVENFQDILLNMYIPDDINISEEEQERNRELLKQDYMMNLKMMVPMFFVLYTLAVAYFSTAAFRVVYNISIGSKTAARPLKRIEWRIKLSAVSAVIIILSAVLNLLLYNRDNPLPSIILSNLQYILAPGFCIMGVYFLFDKIYNAYNKNKFMKTGIAPAIILISICIIGILILNFAGFAVLVIFGLYAALIGDIKTFYDKTKKMVFGDDEDDEDDDDFDI
ncbi:MAG: hypothetical protein FWH24_05065 [Oscillospiraceae bacterium]|nr:hypothetical protein [Oscillospiraceae bacterium]